MTTNNKETTVKNRTDQSVTRQDAREDAYLAPRADIYETPDAFVLALDMPGADRESMSVRLEKGSLLVKAATNHSFGVQGTVIHEESRTPGYYRAFALGDGIDLANVDAQFQDGVLTIKLFKSEDFKPREISIK